jgi:cob(I)alamin adenosyltransferase
MKKAAVYTKTGDHGTTGLVGGTRIKKSDPRIHLYGEVDELNSSIGVGISFLKKDYEQSYLRNIQSRLFDIGSNLACEKEKRSEYKLPQITDEHIHSLELEIDKMDKELPALKFFVLPGGDQAASFFHISRTICRRVERQMVDFEEQHPGEVPEKAAIYMNRLSDYFFTLSRFINLKNNIQEIHWVPEKK